MLNIALKPHDIPQSGILNFKFRIHYRYLKPKALIPLVTTPSPPKANQRVRRTACPTLVGAHSLITLEQVKMANQT